LKVFNYGEVEPEGRLRWLIKGPNFDIRLVEIEPSPNPPREQHLHSWEHEIFILEGNGVIFSEDNVQPFGVGDIIFIPAGEPHAFMNTGKKTLRFICCIPAGVDLDKIKPLTQ